MSDLLQNDSNNQTQLTDTEFVKIFWQGYVESNHGLRFWRPLY
jgi:hypothetical protein